MYIKQIILEGFASYKNRTIIKLDKGLNVLVGHNGSGKSNICRAIGYVLNPTRSNDIQNVYFSVGTTKTQKAIVELIFDTSDHHTINGDEVSIKMVVTPGFRNYYLNNKKVTNNEIKNTLEELGLSQQVIGFLVKKWQIDRIVNGGDSYRMKLLHEVTGSRQFGDKLNELKVNSLRDVNMDQEAAEQLLQALENRERSLQSAVDSLKQYKDANRDKLAILNYMEELDKEQNAEKIQELNDEQTCLEWSEIAALPECAKPCYEANRLKISCDAIERDLAMRKALDEVYRANLLEHEDSRNECWMRHVKIQADMEALQRSQNNKERLAAEAASLQEQISEFEERLDEMQEQIDELTQQERDVNVKCNEVQVRREILHKKRTCWDILNEDEREDAIREELRIVSEFAADAKRCRRSISDQQQKLETDEQDTKKKLQKNAKKKDAIKLKIEASLRSRRLLMDKLELLHRQASDVCLQMKILNAKRNVITYNISKINSTLRSLVDNSLLDGSDSIKRLFKRIEPSIVEEYRGRVVDNFTADTKFYQAIESSAGELLFSHIFNTWNAVEHIVGELERDQTKRYYGRVQMLPLDNLNLEYDVHDENLLIHQLEYDVQFDAVMRLVFGRTVLIDEISESNYDELKSTGLSYVTLDGSFLGTKGGVYKPSIFHTRASVVDLAKQQSECLKQLEQFAVDHEAYVDTLSVIQSGVDKLEVVEQTLHSDFGIDATEKRRMQEKMALLNNTRPALKEAEDSFKVVLHAFGIKLQRLQLEFEEDVPAEDEELLDEEWRNVLEERSAQLKKRYELGCKFLQDNLLEASFELANIEWNIDNEFVESMALEGRFFNDELSRSQEFINQLDEKILEGSSLLAGRASNLEENKLSQLQSQWRRWILKKDGLEMKSRAALGRLDLIAIKQASLGQQVEHPIEQQDIAQLMGNRQSMAKFAGMARGDLGKQLRKCNQLLQNRQHVDTDALNKLEQCRQRLARMMLTYESVKQADEMIQEVLTPQYSSIKRTLVKRTFNKVSARFESLFSQLVPAGSAKLVLIMRDDSDHITDSESMSLDSVGMNGYIGIQIKVSFKEGEEERHLIQLSGGQKAVVAAAFVLALQTVAPAPFYFFDELDGPLDVQYRRRFAQIISEISERAQCITITHLPEQVAMASVLHGVSMQNNVSKVEKISIEGVSPYVRLTHE